MALFLIERNFAEELNITPEIAAAVKQVNMDVGVNAKPTASMRRRMRKPSEKRRSASTRLLMSLLS